MKTTAFFASLVLLFFVSIVRAQNVGVNTDGSSPDPSALLDLKSKSMGLLIPRMKTAERLGISGAVTGLTVFDTETRSFWYHDGSDWLELLPASRMHTIRDMDGDTRVTTEKMADSDQIHFDMGGTQYFTMKEGRLEVENTGHSIKIGTGAGEDHVAGFLKIIAVGDSALHRNIYGSDNTALGYRTLSHTYGGSSNTAVGKDALYWNVSGGSNTAVGTQALRNNTDDHNTAVGALAMFANTSGTRNSAIGYLTLANNTAGRDNTAFGINALSSNSTGSYNVAMGSWALYGNSTGHSNVAIGVEALRLNTDRSNLIAIGDSALYHNGIGVTTTTHAEANMAIGSKSLYQNTTGHNNLSIGFRNLYYNLDGHNNISIGRQSLFNNINGHTNLAIGRSTMYENSSGTGNIAIGDQALFECLDGSGNVVVGRSAGHYCAGANNVMVGNNSGFHVTGSNNVFIGHEAGYDAVGSSKLYIENSRDFYPLIYGDFALDIVGIHGSLGIWTSLPSQEFHVIDGEDTDDDVVIRMQSNNANNDAILQWYEHTVPAMSLHYSGSANAAYLVDLTQDPDTVRVTFKRNGHVGIAKQNPAHLLDVGTNGAFCDGGVWVNGSSRAFKMAVRPLGATAARDAFHKLKPVRYRYKSNPDEEYLGFIAEDVPELVATNDRSGVSSMDIVALLTKVVQDQQAQLDNLLQQVNELKIEIGALKSESH